MEGYQHYSVAEERANIFSHGFGVLFSVFALIMMVVKASLYGNFWHIISVTIFGLSLTALYLASTIYHSTTNAVRRAHLRVVDHAIIYVLIAGTYTPFTLVTLAGSTGWIMFAVSWSMAAVGIILKLFYTGRFNALSTALYVLMGWVIVVALEPLRANMPAAGVNWLFGGGVAYTLGAVVYSIKQIKFNHAIFHLFVLLGSFCHIVSVYFYVLPGK